ncbi:hypothetical protein N0V82_010837 [Gnomoniopsis sp. IMI 355080]|nr:hypothetical protein N0V82_010837 [Gnomoniopsis sp. IMI 355080]
MAPVFSKTTAPIKKTPGKRPSAGVPESLMASKKAKSSRSHVVDDDDDNDHAPTSNVNAGNRSDSGDANEALDEEDEIDDVTNADTVEVQKMAVLRALGLEHLYPGSLGSLSFFDVLLDNSTASQETRAALAIFRQKCLSEAPQRSSEATDAYLNRNVRDWACHSEEVTGLWNDLVEELVKLGLERKYLVKPSGTWGAILAFLWHYPTFNSAHTQYGHVADPTNPSLLAQHRKAGSSDRIFTIDRHPMRHIYVKGGVKWEKEYKHWGKINKLTGDFVKTLLSYSKVLVFVGLENSQHWQDMINKAPGDRLGMVQLTPAKGRTLEPVFGKRQAFHFLKDSTGAIKQLIFVSFHSQYFMHTTYLHTGGYNDLIWNGAMDFCGLEIKEFNTSIAMIGKKAKPKTYVRCPFVDPTTQKTCYHITNPMKVLKKHWDHYHGETAGVSWGETKIEEVNFRKVPLEDQVNRWEPPKPTKVVKPEIERAQLPESMRKLLAPYDAEKARLSSLPSNAVTHAAPRKRPGGKPKDPTAKRARCPYVDPETGEQCRTTLAKVGNLKRDHFLIKHPGVEWDKDAVVMVTQAEMDMLPALPGTMTTAGASLKRVGARSRSAAHITRQREKYLYRCLVPGCNTGTNGTAYTNACSMGTFKNHVEKVHPEVKYRSDLKEKILKNPEGDKENVEPTEN